MRGWAMELGGEGIRVNCVAPGNVFKGSKIWNEEYIKACAKKKGIKPEEVLDHYTAQSPLGKEIEPEDVASAVVYLLSDAARRITGQVLVVDGGQVMVRCAGPGWRGSRDELENRERRRRPARRGDERPAR